MFSMTHTDGRLYLLTTLTYSGRVPRGSSMEGHGSPAPKGWNQKFQGFPGPQAGEEEEHENRLV